MPLTQLDPTAALILIDLQKGIVALPLAHPAAGIVANAAALAHAFRKRGLPVVLVNVIAAAPGRTDMGPRNLALPDRWADLVPELDQQPTDLLISKQRVGAFLGTGLHDLLQQRGITQLFLAGIATGSGVESTARSAYDLGYHVVLITDACTDRSLETHNYCIEKVFPKLAETTSTEELVALLTA